MKTAIFIFALVIILAGAFFYLWKIFKTQKFGSRFNALLLQLLVWGTFLEFFMLINETSEFIYWFWIDVGVLIMMWLLYMAAKHCKRKKH